MKRRRRVPEKRHLILSSTCTHIYVQAHSYIPLHQYVPVYISNTGTHTWNKKKCLNIGTQWSSAGSQGHSSKRGSLVFVDSSAGNSLGDQKGAVLCCETAPETWILSLVHVAHCKDSGKRQKERRGGWRATRDYGLKGPLMELLCTGNRGFGICISTTTQSRQPDSFFLGLGGLLVTVPAGTVVSICCFSHPGMLGTHTRVGQFMLSVLLPCSSGGDSYPSGLELGEGN